jgi:hypothetical protein
LLATDGGHDVIEWILVTMHDIMALIKDLHVREATLPGAFGGIHGGMPRWQREQDWHDACQFVIIRHDTRVYLVRNASVIVDDVHANHGNGRIRVRGEGGEQVVQAGRSHERREPRESFQIQLVLISSPPLEKIKSEPMDRSLVLRYLIHKKEREYVVTNNDDSDDLDGEFDDDAADPGDIAKALVDAIKAGMGGGDAAALRELFKLGSKGGRKNPIDDRVVGLSQDIDRLRPYMSVEGEPFEGIEDRIKSDPMNLEDRHELLEIAKKLKQSKNMFSENRSKRGMVKDLGRLFGKMGVS